MLSVIVIVPPRADRARPFAPLLRTLAALVTASVDGMVRDVTLLALGPVDDVAGIADEAGCGVIAGDDFGTAMTRSLRLAKSAWVCVMQAGTVPGATFVEDVASALAQNGDPPQALLLRGEGRAFGRLFPRLATVAGVIAPRARLNEGPAPASFADLVRRSRPVRTLVGRVAQVA